MGENIKLKKIINSYFDKFYGYFPTTATVMGIHDYDNDLDKLSEESIESFLGDLKFFKNDLKDVEADGLDNENKLNHKLLISNIEANERNFGRIRTWKINPQIYMEVIIYGLYFVATRNYLPPQVRAGSILGRLKQVKRVLNECRGNIDPGLCPKPYVEAALESIQGGKELFTKLIPHFAKETSSENELLTAGNEAYEVWCNFENYLEDQLLGLCKGEMHVGKAEINNILSNDHMLDYTVDQVYEMGLAEYRKINAGLEELAKEIDPGRTWNEILNEAQRNFKLTNGEVISLYRSELNKLAGFVRDRDLVSIPEEVNLQIIKTPDFKKSTTPFATLFSPTPFETDQTGTMLLTMKDDEKELSWHFSYPFVALHEGIPGHYLQRVKHHTNKKVSKERHKLCGFGLFVERKQPKLNLFEEGWAVYCEALMVEEGYFSDPVYKLLGLKYQLWRAARMIVEAGLHARKIGYDEAVDFLVNNLGHSKVAAQKEMRYHSMTLTQAMSYMLGKLETEKLREECLKRGMSKRDFHEKFLSYGSIPIKLLRNEILGLDTD